MSGGIVTARAATKAASYYHGYDSLGFPARSSGKVKRHKTAAEMTKYHRTIIHRLCERYSGEELTDKLKELKFCTAEVAVQVAEQYMSNKEDNND